MRAATRTRRSSGDLVQESHIRIVQNPYVGDVVAEHRDARRAHAERPAGVAIGVESRGIDHSRMHHPGAEYLHPAGALAAWAPRPVTQLALHIHLGRRLREREIARAETCLRLAEEFVGE